MLDSLSRLFITGPCGMATSESKGQEIVVTADGASEIFSVDTLRWREGMAMSMINESLKLPGVLETLNLNKIKVKHIRKSNQRILQGYLNHIPTGPGLPANIDYSSVAQLDDTFYLLGGQDSAGSIPTDAVFKYNQEEEAWEEAGIKVKMGGGEDENGFFG